MFLSLVVATMCGARAANAAEVEIERMTWVEVRDAIAAGATTVIIPTGGTEQNGAHMVLGKHNFIVAEAARRIARELGDALVAPVLAYVPEGDVEARDGHMAYAGTISLSEEPFKSVLEAAARSFKAHGFKTIVFLGDSGGNQEPQAELAGVLSSAWSSEGARVVNAGAYYGDNGGVAMLEAEGESAEAIGTHAGIRDTSELMAVFPAGVRLEGAKPDQDGATGDPSRASAERGEKLLALKVSAAVAEIKAAQTRVEGADAREQQGLFSWLYGLIAG